MHDCSESSNFICTRKGRGAWIIKAEIIQQSDSKTQLEIGHLGAAAQACFPPNSAHFVHSQFFACALVSV